VHEQKDVMQTEAIFQIQMKLYMHNGLSLHHQVVEGVEDQLLIIVRMEILVLVVTMEPVVNHQ
jgi:hypothetical protein